MTCHSVARGAFWFALVAFAMFGVGAGMGLGPGPLIGAVALAAYDIKRHVQIPTPGYVLLIAAMPAVAYMTLLAARSGE